MLSASLSILPSIPYAINSNKMKSPFTGGEVIKTIEKSKITFRKEEFTYTYVCYKCVDTGETFTTTETDEVNVAQIYNQYRVRHDIPFPDEIRNVRSQYKLSASKMSQILGFGENQYRLYENGDIPNVANGRVLRAIQTPQTFLSFVIAAKKVLTQAEYDRVTKSIGEQSDKAIGRNMMARLVFQDTPCGEFNGYATQSLSRVKNVMLYFINKFDGVFVTMMNKLLFYTDFLSYKETGRAMTGLSYKAIQWGPVPDRWDKVYSLT